MLGLREGIREHYGRRCTSKTRHPNGATCFTFENYTLDELIAQLERNRNCGAFREMLERYRVRSGYPHMSDFRLGPNTFDKTALDWIIFASDDTRANSELIAHGVTTRIRWNTEVASLPRGWIGCVRASYEDVVIGGERPTTLIGLFIFAEQAFREHGWAAEVAQEMKRLASAAGLRELIIPLRLPTRYEWQFARMPYEEFAFLKREDGAYRDHWLRMHVRLGAEVRGICPVSHQHAMHPDDLAAQMRCDPIKQTGEYVLKWNDEYYLVSVDFEREVAVINEGCVWVQHAL